LSAKASPPDRKNDHPGRGEAQAGTCGAPLRG